MKDTGAINAELIEEAIVNQEFFLHYQPQSSLYSGKIVGVEALTRWNCESQGNIEPSVLIDIIENSGIDLITKFHESTIRTAFTQIVAWREIGIYTPIDINFSTRFLQEKECLALIKRLLQEYDLPPSCFGIEVTESSSIAKMTDIQFVLHSLYEMGIQIALDDFCTGYSSLDYISELAVTKIKLDKRFIHRLDSDSIQSRKSTSIILESIIDMAAKLGLGVVAEGVETMKQLEEVTLFGCDAYQGYLFCPPVPSDLATVMILKATDRKPDNLLNHNLASESFLSEYFLKLRAASYSMHSAAA
jgi:EAL domain-containing protein (putative c-di-GMP-specific phosphodiesterase class I)